MKGTTHLLFGLILAAIATQYFTFESPLLAVILILLSSLLPDIDERHSILGRKIPIISFFTKHRTFFHSIFFLVLTIIVLSFFLEEEYLVVTVIGFVGHLLLDALTPAGVKPFWPSQVKIKGFVPVGSLLEKLIFAIFIIIFIVILI